MSHELWRESLKRLRAIAQTGQTYSKDPYDRERYEELEAMALTLLACKRDDAYDQHEIVVGPDYYWFRERHTSEPRGEPAWGWRNSQSASVPASGECAAAKRITCFRRYPSGDT